MNKLLKRLAGMTSERCQQTLKRYHFARQIQRGVFQTGEPEYAQLDHLVAEGDWVIDIGANVGHYTWRLSQLVKSSGRVFAFEPIPYTFELLSANCALSPYRNITLLNAAASNTIDLVTMEIPEREQGGRLNYYRAHITSRTGQSSGWSILALDVDRLKLPRRVSLVKIDAEGHEREVVEGMSQLIATSRPVLIVEGNEADSVLLSLGYRAEHAEGSPNTLWRYGTKE